MEDVRMYCNNSECPCEDICCQDCEQITTCDKKCNSVKYKEKIYSDTEYLVNELENLADRQDNWLIAVAAEKINSLSNELKEYREAIEKGANILKLHRCETAEKIGDKCRGYQRSYDDDEPAEMCKSCSYNIFHKE